MLTFAAPSAAWLFVLLLPLLAFYFLKLRRPHQEVSSLALWRQVLNDQRVNSPFQRFKRNLLLLLQILLLTLLAFAAMQPAVRRGPIQAHRLPILIDCSASMGALDRAGGSSRLDAAKKRVNELIDNLLPDQEICLISFAKSAHKLTSFTNDQSVLRGALTAIQLEDIPGDLEDALRLAQAQARSTPFDAAMILSDGNFPAQTNFELSFKVDYQRLPPGGPNLGIVACSARRSAAEAKWQVFVEIDGSAGASEGAVVELSRNGVVIDTERLSANAAGGKPSARLNFNVDGTDAAKLRVRLIPDGFDSLATDNEAYINLPLARPLNVYVELSLGSWRHAFQALSGIRLFPPDDAADGNAPPSEIRYDLAVAERPESLPDEASLLCTVGFVPPDLVKLVAIEEAPSGVVDWRRESPLLQHVELTDLVLSERPTTKPDVAEGDFANLGYEILAQGGSGPLMLEKPAAERPSVHLLFHTDRSTLPYRVGFPVLVANLAQSAMKQNHLSEVEAVHTGTLPALKLQAEYDYRALGPNGTIQSARSDEQGILSGIAATRTGEYRMMEGNSERETIGASLLSASETGLEASTAIRFNEQLSTSAATAELKTDRPIWFPLALLAFVLLLVEWWFFQKRPVRMTTIKLQPR